MTPTVTSKIGHMEILAEQKLCRKGLHWYPITDKGCPLCNRIAIRKWKQANRERVNETARKRYLVKREDKLEKNKKWAQANREYRREYRRKRAPVNREHRREYRKKWGEANLGTLSAYNARRRAAKKNALMPWADVNAIKNFYTEARRLTKLTGVKHHVDHIYPLQSEYMCGLHVETNLQILTEKENIAKGNRTWPGQLECQKGSVYARFPKELTDLLNDKQT